MKQTTLCYAALLGLAAMTAVAPGSAQAAITEEEAHAIGVDAYLYFYPLISFDTTRLYSTNIEPGKEPLKGPMNSFASAAAYPSATTSLSCGSTSTHFIRSHTWT